MINAVGITWVWSQAKVLDPFKITLKVQREDVWANWLAKNFGYHRTSAIQHSPRLLPRNLPVIGNLNQ